MFWGANFFQCSMFYAKVFLIFEEKSKKIAIYLDWNFVEKVFWI